MELSKYKNHRNTKYLAWLRKQDCVIAGRKADVAHHVNIGTNGGKGLKASDYFCIPLLNEFHTTGLWAVHSVGELSFLESFKLNRNKMFIFYLNQYLKEVHKVEFNEGEDKSDLETIYLLIENIEKFNQPSSQSLKKMDKKKVIKKIPKSDYYEKSKELKKNYNKEMRKKCQDLKLADKVVKNDTMKEKMSETDYYKKSKELKKKYSKEMREKNKIKLSQYRKEQYKKNKEYQKNISSP